MSLEHGSNALVSNAASLGLRYSSGPSHASIETGCTVQRRGVLDCKLSKEKYLQRMDMLEVKNENCTL